MILNILLSVSGEGDVITTLILLGVILVVGTVLDIWYRHKK